MMGGILRSSGSPSRIVSSTGKRSRGQENGSPEIIQELLDTNSEWTNVPDIIKLTFKGIYHTLKVQNECIRDIEQILPAKANTDEILHEMRQSMTQKANLNDMKKTMSEVAQALEQRTSFHDVRRLLEGKPDQSELTHLLQ
jgi:hypothetical protein